MTGWGKRKDGQAYPKNVSKNGIKSSNTKPISDIHMKERKKTYEDLPYVRYSKLEFTHMLHDIDEKVNQKNIEKVVKDNIKEVLEKDHNWKDGYVITIPENSMKIFEPSEGDEEGHVIYNYEVKDHTGKIKHFGIIQGWIRHGKLDQMELSYYNHQILMLNNNIPLNFDLSK